MSTNRAERIYLATNNAHKVGEIMDSVRLLGSSIEFRNASEVGGMDEVEENGDTLQANARIKAEALACKAPGKWICADDTGLFVDALNGAPGVHTARYAGPECSSSDNNAKLLEALSGVPAQRRKAQFRCCLHVISPLGKSFSFEGVFHGSIAESLSGKGGFGYDPLFIPDGYPCTVSELSSEEKNKISHRALAVRSLVEVLG